MNLNLCLESFLTAAKSGDAVEVKKNRSKKVESKKYRPKFYLNLF